MTDVIFLYFQILIFPGFLSKDSRIKFVESQFSGKLDLNEDFRSVVKLVFLNICMMFLQVVHFNDVVQYFTC